MGSGSTPRVRERATPGSTAAAAALAAASLAPAPASPSRRRYRLARSRTSSSSSSVQRRSSGMICGRRSSQRVANFASADTAEARTAAFSRITRL